MGQIKLVSLGGGGGQSAVLRALAGGTQYQITAVCTVSDSGGDTGTIAREYRKLGINGSFGDVGKCLCALSPDSQLAGDLSHRFDSGSREGQSIKNSLYLGLIRRYGLRLGLERLHQILSLPEQFRVWPASFQRTVLRFRLADGTTWSHEALLDLLSSQKLWNPKVHAVKKVWLIPKPSAEEEVLQAIDQAHWIILSPGDLFTSVIPVLLVGDIAKAIAHSPGKLLVVMNLMTKVGETDGFTAADFIRQMRKHMDGRVPDVVVCNSNGIPEESLRRYRRKEHKVAVVPHTLAGTEFEQVQLDSADLWGKTPEGYIVHDPDKLRPVLKEILS